MPATLPPGWSRSRRRGLWRQVGGLEVVDVGGPEAEVATGAGQARGGEEAEAGPAGHGRRGDVEPFCDVLCREVRGRGHMTCCSARYGSTSRTPHMGIL